MRVPRCSISLWSDVIGETSLPLCVRQSGRGLPARLQIILLLGTLTFPSVFEVISETVAHDLGTSGGDLPGGLRRPRARVCQAISFLERSACLAALSVLPLDREQELA